VAYSGGNAATQPANAPVNVRDKAVALGFMSTGSDTAYNQAVVAGEAAVKNLVFNYQFNQ